MNRMPHVSPEMFQQSFPPRNPGDFACIGLAVGEKKSGKISTQELLERIAELSEKVSFINLMANKLGLSNPEFLVALAKSFVLKPHLVEIDLCFNEFHKMKSEHLADFFRQLPESIKKVSLKNNYLGLIPFADFQQIIQAISSNNRILDLSDNNLDNFSQIELQIFFQTLELEIKIQDIKEEDLWDALQP